MMFEDMSDSTDTESNDDYESPTEEDIHQGSLSYYVKGRALAPSHAFQLSTCSPLVC